MDTTQTLIERDINELFQQTLAGQNRGRQIGLLRRVIAYGFKLIAGGASVIVAINKFPEYYQVCGAAAVIAIFLDSVFSNHKRLLVAVQAGYAFDFLRERVSREYNRALDPLLRILQDSSSGASQKRNAQLEVDKLQQRTHKELTEEIAKIRQSLAQADLKALEGLALDNERAAAQLNDSGRT